MSKFIDNLIQITGDKLSKLLNSENNKVENTETKFENSKFENSEQEKIQVEPEKPFLRRKKMKNLKHKDSARILLMTTPNRFEFDTPETFTPEEWKTYSEKNEQSLAKIYGYTKHNDHLYSSELKGVRFIISIDVTRILYNSESILLSTSEKIMFCTRFTYYNVYRNSLDNEQKEVLEYLMYPFYNSRTGKFLLNTIRKSLIAEIEETEDIPKIQEKTTLASTPRLNMSENKHPKNITLEKWKTYSQENENLLAKIYNYTVINEKFGGVKNNALISKRFINLYSKASKDFIKYIPKFSFPKGEHRRADSIAFCVRYTYYCMYYNVLDTKEKDLLEYLMYPFYDPFDKRLYDGI